MAIHTESQIEISGGFEKQIESSAMGMMLDILQKFQYQYPIKSIIRELVSNGLDAIKERDVAIDILNGKSKVEDYYLDRDGAIYQDSRFNPDYYQPEYLSDKSQVFIDYYANSSSEKDYITIRDNGVGLGGQRLQKYFSLGYSTKRLNKAQIGKFGINIPVPLSSN